MPSPQSRLPTPLLKAFYFLYKHPNLIRLIVVVAIAINIILAIPSLRVPLMAHLGSSQAAYELAKMYATGDGVTKDEAQAFHWTLKAGQRGNRDAAFDLAKDYETGKHVAANPATAITWYRTAAKEGHPQAQFHMGQITEAGNGVPQDTTQAFAYYQGAAKGKVTGAYYALGRCYEQGIGTIENAVKALSWYKKAGVLGFAPATYALGRLYVMGPTGVAKNYDKAMMWFAAASARQYPGAAHAIDNIFTLGRIKNNDSYVITRWAKIGALQGDAKEEYLLGFFYDTGTAAFPHDPVKAYKWYLKAAKQGYDRAQMHLATLLEQQKVPILALKWYLIAAKSGTDGAHQAAQKLSDTMNDADRAKATKAAQAWKPIHTPPLPHPLP